MLYYILLRKVEWLINNRRCESVLVSGAFAITLIGHKSFIFEPRYSMYTHPPTFFMMLCDNRLGTIIHDFNMF